MVLRSGQDQRKGFNILVKPNSSEHFLYFRAIQEHSGGILVDLTLQENVLLPDDFAEYMYHIVYVSENTFNNEKWIDPRRKRSQEGQAIRVLHCSEPDGRRSKNGRRSTRFGQTTGRTVQTSWRSLHNTLYWCSVKLAQRKGLHFCQTRSHAIVLFNTLPAICIEKMVCMKTKEE